MKKVIFALIILVIGVISCKKQSTEQDAITSLKQLVVGRDFNWNTSKTIEFIIKNAPRGIVRISSSDEQILYAKLYSTSPAVDLPLTVTLPVYVNQLSINGHIVDLTGNSVTVTLNNQKTVETTNFSMSFNGLSDWIKVPQSSSMSYTNTLTMEAWVKATRQQTAKIIQKGDWDGFGLGQDLWNGWQAGMAMADGSSVLANWGMGQPLLNHWYHLAATYNGSNFKLFVDGVEMKNIPVTQNIKTNNRNVSIGSDNGNQKFFQGQIDEPSLWGIALTQQQVAGSVNIPWIGNEPGLTALWHFNEGSGVISLDSSPHHNDGTIYGATFNTEVGYNPTSDTDSDGVQNSYDDFPEDPARAFITSTPASGIGSLAFEDLWPNTGDYDFNDLVVDYRFNNITNSSNFLVETYAVFILRAAGAGFSNGFGFQLPSNAIPASTITASGSHLSEDFIILSANGLEAQQSLPTIIVFDNAFNVIVPPGGGTGFNTTSGMQYKDPDTITIYLQYPPNFYTASQLNIGNFNPFMIVNKTRGKEIHLPDFPPTSLADIAYFGQGQDNSEPATGRYYKTAGNLPWAINIVSPFAYPYEKADILLAYQHIAEWAQTNGSAYQDWYADLPGYRNEAWIWSPTP